MSDKLVLDVRSMPPSQRHSNIFDTFNRLAPGQVMQLINDHDPKPLYYQMAAEMPGTFEWKYIEEGPEDWKVDIKKISSSKNPTSLQNATTDFEAGDDRGGFDPFQPIH
jgi:uncharacterized protein (DUF2249 family)